MGDQSDFNKKALEEKFEILLAEDNQLKKWNEGLLIKALILLPIVIFLIGLFIVNRPEKIIDVLFVLLYPLTLISIGLIVLFFMGRNLK